MLKTTVSRLLADAKRFFDLVEHGETIRILRNGRPIADLHPIHRVVPSWKQRKAQPLAIRDVSVSNLIVEERGR